MQSKFNTSNNSLGHRIRSLRQRKNETQKELADLLNKSESAIRMWELGKSEPDIETLKLLALHFDVPISYLVDEKYEINGHIKYIMYQKEGSISIRSRDGSVIESELSDEQLENVKRIIEQFNGKSIINMQRLKQLRKEHKITAKQLGEKLQVAESTISLYENGKREPNFKTLLKIADYFCVSVDYLLGKEEQEKKPAENGELTEHEQNLINAYRLQPHLQEAVDRVLGIKDLKILGTERDGKVILFKAASSQNHHDTEIIEMDAEQWKKIKESPNTDDSLL